MFWGVGVREVVVGLDVVLGENIPVVVRYYLPWPRGRSGSVTVCLVVDGRFWGVRLRDTSGSPVFLCNFLLLLLFCEDPDGNWHTTTFSVLFCTLQEVKGQKYYTDLCALPLLVTFSPDTCIHRTVCF